MAPATPADSFKRGLEDIESSSLPSDAKAQLIVVRSDSLLYATSG